MSQTAFWRPSADLESALKMKSKLRVLAATAILAAPVVAAASSGELVERVDSSFPLDARTQSFEFEAVPTYSADDVALFEANKGERLKDVLSRWTQSVGYDLVWQPGPEDGDLQLSGSIEFEDTFFNATEEFFGLVREQSPFDAQIHPNKVLRVFLANNKQ